MGADPIVYCLEKLTDYSEFERLCHELMALEGYASLEPLGGFHDKGRDAVHVNRADGVITIFCYSVRDDWLVKLKADAKVIHQHEHACDRLVYLSTHNVAATERDVAVKFITDAYGWKLDVFGIERFRLLLSAKYGTLIRNHPQIFHPSFFELPVSEPAEASRIRSLMDRLVIANEKYNRAHLRFVVWPCPEDFSAYRPSSKNQQIAVAIPTKDATGPAPDGANVVLSQAAVKNCSQADFWGSVGVRREGRNGTQESRLLFLVWGGPDADAAAEELNQLTAESGRLYQTLPPSLAPIHGTTSPRNLWIAVLYGWLRGSMWIHQDEGFECVHSPSAKPPPSLLTYRTRTC